MTKKHSSRGALPLWTVFWVLGVSAGQSAISADQITYTYDALGRLHSVLYQNGTEFVYTYDPAGNRTSVGYPPPTISSFNATPTAISSISLTWSATDNGGPGGLTYSVKRGSTVLSGCTSSPCTDTGLSAGTSYTYTLAAKDSKGDVATASTNGSTYPIPSVSVTAAAVSTSQIQVTWTGNDTNGPGIKNYTVYRGATLLSCTSSPCNDTGLATHTGYTYTVYIYDTLNDVGTGTASATTYPLPSVPTGLAGSATSKSQVTLTWTASTDTGGPGVAGYSVYRGGTKIGTSTSTSYSDSGLTAGTTYSYTVSAYDSVGTTSAQSSSTSVTTWYQITDANGKVISGASSVYGSVIGYGTCFGGNYNGYMELFQSYGSKSMVASIVSLQQCQAACPTGGVTSNLSSGYQRPSNNSCEIDATSAVYGH